MSGEEALLEEQRIILEEYKWLRAETLQAQASQQTTLQWTIGALGLLFAGALALGSPKDSSGSVPSVFFFVFGVLLPAGGFVSALAWYGDVLRMERVGFYLRAREPLFWHSDVALLDQPLAWESFLRETPTRDGGKHKLLYLAAIGIYFGGTAASLIVFWMSVRGYGFDGSDPNWVRHDAQWWALGWAIVILVVFAAFFYYLRTSILQLARRDARDVGSDLKVVSTRDGRLRVASPAKSSSTRELASPPRPPENGVIERL